MFRPPSGPRAEVVEEQGLKATIPEIAPITDAVSLSVQAMYETNPYPRWTHLARRPPVDVRAALMRDFPHATEVEFGEGPLEVLMPGAGTGQHPLTVASSYANARVTGVDLSRASLAYGSAWRHATASTTSTSCAATFSTCRNLVAASTMPSASACCITWPIRGRVCRRSPRCCGPAPSCGSASTARVRALVVKARSDIEMARLPSTLDGLREFRRKVMSGEWRRLRPLTAWEDFWSASLLRDLCFHVQEHRFTVSRLRTFLEGSGLRFLGFEFNVGASQSAAAHAGPLELYRARFPTERTMSDLARWEQLEREKSNLFPGYAFICQKE